MSDHPFDHSPNLFNKDILGHNLHMKPENQLPLQGWNNQHKNPNNTWKRGLYSFWYHYTSGCKYIPVIQLLQPYTTHL